MRFLVCGSMLLVAGVTMAAPIKIMALGDSITYGYPVPGGYRAPLASMLQTEGYSFDFVGSQTDDPMFGFQFPHHEGHPGWQASDISTQISGWLTAANPDVVLLHIGTNDLSYTYNASVVASRLDILIGQITSQEPNVKLIVASVVPRLDVVEHISRQYNNLIPNVVDSYHSQGFKVSFLDMHAALDSTDLYDVVHPNASGYNKMAAAWNGAFVAVNPVPEPTIGFAIGTGLFGWYVRRRARR